MRSTTHDIVRLVYGLLGTITVPKYMYDKPTHVVAGEYLVVNALPIDSDVMQICHVNVNYHVKDLSPGVADHSKLKAGADAVLAILEKVSTATYLIDFETQTVMKELNQDEHFSNLRFSVKNINN